MVGNAINNNLKESIPDRSRVIGLEVPKDQWVSKIATSRSKDYIIVQNDNVKIRRITHCENGVVTCEPLNKSYEVRDITIDDVNQLLNFDEVHIKRSE